jgi:dTDP-glucose pyrophosphorylase/CBS domain-containing protein
MMEVEKFVVAPHSTVREVMSCIDRNARGIALVVDEERRLIGTLTDGDIRRAILDDLSLDVTANELLARKVNSSYIRPVTAQVGTRRGELLELMQGRGVRQIPLVDGAGRLLDLITLDELLPKQVLPLQAVIMAGGLGTRLRPLTEEIPKPMLPLGDRPLMERTIERLREAGIRRVNVTTHYRPEKITDHFGDGQEFGVEINYVAESRPLGTAGALGLMEAPHEPLLVINGDILTRVDFRAMLDYHRKHAADLTLGVRHYDLQVPYGIVECEGPQVRQVREKPMFHFLVNAGIYLLEPSMHQYIPRGQHFDMTDLIQRLLENKCAVLSFPIVEYWLDIGQYDDYEQAQEDVKNGRWSP